MADEEFRNRGVVWQNKKEDVKTVNILQVHAISVRRACSYSRARMPSRHMQGHIFQNPSLMIGVVDSRQNPPAKGKHKLAGPQV
jgi:hypothetical protein